MTFGRERYAPIPGETPNGASTVQIQASFSWREIPRDRVILGKILGEGEFGMVVRGEFSEDDGHVIHCAVKKLKRTLNICYLFHSMKYGNSLILFHKMLKNQESTAQ